MRHQVLNQPSQTHDISASVSQLAPPRLNVGHHVRHGRDRTSCRKDCIVWVGQVLSVNDS